MPETWKLCPRSALRKRRFFSALQAALDAEPGMNFIASEVSNVTTRRSARGVTCSIHSRMPMLSSPDAPLSVHRYFGTKERVVVADEFDALRQDALADVFDTADPVAAKRRIVADSESVVVSQDGTAPTGGKGPWRRVRYFFQQPSVRLDVYALLDQASKAITAALVERWGMSPTKARVAAHAFAFGYFAALEQWYLEGGVHPIVDYVDKGMSVLREIWPEPAK